jgi:hypothetical protein
MPPAGEYGIFIGGQPCSVARGRHMRAYYAVK